MHPLTLGGQAIPIENDHEHLGLTLPTDSRFHTHLSNILQKFNRSLSPLLPLAHLNDILQKFNRSLGPLLPLAHFSDILQHLNRLLGPLLPLADLSDILQH